MDPSRHTGRHGVEHLPAGPRPLHSGSGIFRIRNRIAGESDRPRTTVARSKQSGYAGPTARRPARAWAGIGVTGGVWPRLAVAGLLGGLLWAGYFLVTLDSAGM